MGTGVAKTNYEHKRQRKRERERQLREAETFSLRVWPSRPSPLRWLRLARSQAREQVWSLL